ncbi:putative gibberellin 20-oxidase [Amniculicola lignicola CBS 123094]|uniref:Putative gibberellin 20-oxidase n=1 Tax=Amniculicola lignicola CBS 123094 TaxID=1392246 RepID=A0A6A5WTL5_9PLEO|nr:putative gibberellin 20-oxidase [Amniculicola lignicola CBS 123094]
MATSFSSLPIVDVSALKQPEPSDGDIGALSAQLYDVFATTGFAYIVNAPLSFDHAEIFRLAKEFFALDSGTKMKLAKKSFQPGHANTYRGYFPTQPHLALDNLKEGFEIGSRTTSYESLPSPSQDKINLSEPNVWPNKELFAAQARLEQLYEELQTFASQLLSLLAVSLGKAPDFFCSWLVDPLSTLRLLHYPPVPQDPKTVLDEGPVKLSCTPHTDSGILTLLYQDSTGGLEVLNASGDWIPAPSVPGSIVVNIGDLMAQVSNGRLTATMHRVRAPRPKPSSSGDAFGRFSIPFFFEPGEACIVTPVDGDDEVVIYGEHVRKKMSTWVEFQDDSGYDTASTTG